jgi:preprotein translocase subunit SecY
MINFLRLKFNRILNFGAKFAYLIMKLISNVFKKLCEQKKKRLISQIVKLIAFLVMFYQFILVTISYLKYETVIDMKANHNEEQRTTFTFCLKNEDECPQKI